MKIRIVNIAPGEEEHIDLYIREGSAIQEKIENIIKTEEYTLFGYTEREASVIDISSVICFISEIGRVIAITEGGRFTVKETLTELEEHLPEQFIKINRSAIANIRKIEKFDVSFSGTLGVIFKNGYKDYVSRRNLKKIKERLGL